MVVDADQLTERLAVGGRIGDHGATGSITSSTSIETMAKRMSPLVEK